jgi:hypothetical protein
MSASYALDLSMDAFKRSKKPPKTPDIALSTDIPTFTRIGFGAVEWKEAVKDGKLTVKRGEPTDIQMLVRILR